VALELIVSPPEDGSQTTTAPGKPTPFERTWSLRGLGRVVPTSALWLSLEATAVAVMTGLLAVESSHPAWSASTRSPAGMARTMDLMAADLALGELEFEVHDRTAV